MTTSLAPEPVTAPPGTDDDEGVWHFTCCSRDIAMCGENVAGTPWAAESDVIGSGEPTCPMCELVYGGNLPCPVPGCPWRGDADA